MWNSKVGWKFLYLSPKSFDLHQIFTFGLNYFSQIWNQCSERTFFVQVLNWPKITSLKKLTNQSSNSGVIWPLSIILDILFEKFCKWKATFVIQVSSVRSLSTALMDGLFVDTIVVVVVAMYKVFLEDCRKWVRSQWGPHNRPRSICSIALSNRYTLRPIGNNKFLLDRMYRKCQLQRTHRNSLCNEWWDNTSEATN